MVTGGFLVVACVGPHTGAPDPKTDVLGYGRGGAVRVTCSDEDDCTELAAQTCPGGYEIGAQDDTPAVYVTVGRRSALAAPEKHELFIDCHTREEAKPSWEMAKRDKGYGELAVRVAAPAPSGLAGFPLEGGLEAARSRCADAHQEWKDVRDGQGECSGTPTSQIRGEDEGLRLRDGAHRLLDRGDRGAGWCPRSERPLDFVTRIAARRARRSLRQAHRDHSPVAGGVSGRCAPRLPFERQGSVQLSVVLG
jgi:hypothetical protein